MAESGKLVIVSSVIDSLHANFWHHGFPEQEHSSEYGMVGMLAGTRPLVHWLYSEQCSPRYHVYSSPSVSGNLGDQE